MATEAARLDGKKIHISNNKTVLTHTGLLMEGVEKTVRTFDGQLALETASDCAFDWIYSPAL